MLNKKALAASVSAPPSPFVEDVFSTYLYTGTGANQTITNNIDLAGKGGLVWIKDRTNAGSTDYNHYLAASNPGYSTGLSSNTTGAGGYSPVQSVSSTGFVDRAGWPNGNPIVSWTFRKAPKFFDVQTYTGNGAGFQSVPHSLASFPGMIMIKRTDSTSDWVVVQNSGQGPASTQLPPHQPLFLNTTAAALGFDQSYSYGATSTAFFASTNTNVNGATYVAYLFAHNAGGFGTAGTDNVISCGYAAAGTTVNLGYEPQWVMTKNPNAVGNWRLFDTMRGLLVGGTSRQLIPNTSDAEGNSGGFVELTSTGFYSGADAIYMAIRRPMKVPTVATTVFNPVYGQSGAPGFRSSNFNAGMDTSFVFLTSGYNDGTAAYQNIQTRLTGLGQLQTANQRAEVSQSYNTWDYMNGQNNTTFYSPPWGSWMFKRASGFHDVVCFTGNGTAGRAINHNLTVAPELMIVKSRSINGESWTTYVPGPKVAFLDYPAAASTSVSTYFGDNSVTVPPTSSVFTVGSNDSVNQNAATYVAYLFATCAGVSKVGTYTGNGGTQAIACGFTGGARFVLIKRSDASGDWYVYDTTRGMTTTTNPYLKLNTYDAEVATSGSVTTTTGGFTVNATVLAAINASGGSYIFLAIA